MKRRLKVKKRSLLMIVAMLSVFLFGIGTAHAVTGVNDAVPGYDTVIPFICEGHSNPPAGAPTFGGLNTVWAIAETTGGSCEDPICTPDHGGNVGIVKADIVAFDRNSVPRFDGTACWSAFDVITGSCQEVVSGMNTSAQQAMEITLNGVVYFAGYITYTQTDWCDFDDNRFVSWAYINNIAKGFAAGFNGIEAENGINNTAWDKFGEACNGNENCSPSPTGDDNIGVTARTIYPRYFILNSNPDSLNWWILLLGRNQYTFANVWNRTLECVFCNEDEVCKSNSIPIPTELNFIDVAGFIPQSVYPVATFAKAGFAMCDIKEVGRLEGENASTTILGTLSFPCVGPTPDPTFCETYSFYGWSYQQGVPVSVSAKVAAMHEIHRRYCNGDNTPIGQAWELPNRFEEGTVSPCTLKGPAVIAP